MKKITKEYLLTLDFNKKTGRIQCVKWNDIFENEEEMITKIIELKKYITPFKTNHYIADTKRDNVNEKVVRQFKRMVYCIVEVFGNGTLTDEEEQEVIKILTN